MFTEEEEKRRKAEEAAKSSKGDAPAPPPTEATAAEKKAAKPRKEKGIVITCRVCSMARASHRTWDSGGCWIARFIETGSKCK